MFKAVLVVVWSVCVTAPLQAQPANDECAGATPLAVGSNPHDSTGATDSPVAVDPTGCNVLGSVAGDVWYSYTNVSPGPMLVTVETCASGFDTDLIAYDVTCPVTSADQIACDGDGCPGNFSSSMTWTIGPGAVHMVRVGEWGAGGVGWVGTIEVSEVPTGGVGDILLLDWDSINNSAAAAIDCLGLTGSTTFVTNGAEFDLAMATTTFNTIVIDNSTNLLSAAAELAIVDHIAAGGGAVVSYWAMDTSSSALKAALGISAGLDYVGVFGISSGVCCPGDSVWIGPNAIPGEAVGPTAAPGFFDNGDFLTPASGIARGEFPGGEVALVSDNGGATFLIGPTLDSLEESGARDITANALEEVLSATVGATGSGPCSLLNDTCFTAQPVLLGATPFSTVGAVDEGVAASCMTAMSNDVWFQFTPLCDGDYVIDTCGSSFDTTLAIFDECSGTELFCDDDTCGTQSAINVALVSGLTYRIQVAGAFGATGVGVLTIAPLATVLPNDGCLSAIALTAGVSEPFNTICATNDGPLSSCGAPTPIDPDVWYTYTATQDAMVVVDTCGSSLDTVLEVYSDCPGVGTVLNCNDDSCGLQAQLGMPMLSGETITIRLTGFAAATGIGEITVTELPAIDGTLFDVVLVNGEGDVDGGLVLSEAAYMDALAAAGLSVVAIEPNLFQLIIGCPVVGWIYNNGTLPDDSPIDQDLMVMIRDCVLAGNGAIVQGGDNWGFQGPSAYDEVDGIDEATSLDGGDQVTTIAGYPGSSMNAFASDYTQDQAGNDWTDNLMLADPAAGTELMGGLQEFALESPSAGHAVAVYYPHDELVVPGAGNTYSASVEPAGMDDPAAYLATVFELVNFSIATFSRGDCDDDSFFTISDPVVALAAIFVIGATPLACADACDANDDGAVDIADPVSMLASLFIIGSPQPQTPTFPNCGTDPTVDTVGCAAATAACP